ncbi:glycosyltransferase [Deinococcus caeni]|uniref:glycosyltransferase n=1 Tax=Deinococcus caeni TaxID=569127 RepID=UPI00361C4EB9
MNVLALPTYREGFPTVALEASAFGLPLVTTDATGARDAVQDGVTGWRVPVGDAAALGVALTAALTDPAEARRRRGRASVGTEALRPRAGAGTLGNLL